MSGPGDVAARLEDMATAYIGGAILTSAVELGLFDVLVEPLPIAVLADRMSATVDGTRRLVRALACMGLLEVDAGVARAPLEVSEVLRRDRPGNIAGVLRHHARHLYPLMGRLPLAIVTGKPQHDAWDFASSTPADGCYEELARHPTEYETFLSAMDHGSRGVGASIARTLDLSAVRRLIDLGGGAGGVARELLEALPALRIQTFDLGPAISVAEERGAALSARHVTRRGDIVAGIDADPCEAVLLSAILADWTIEKRRTILQNALRLLEPGGLLIISETLLDDDRMGPTRPAILSLVLLVALGGEQLSYEEISEDLRATGFEAIELHRASPRDIVCARKPQRPNVMAGPGVSTPSGS